MLFAFWFLMLYILKKVHERIISKMYHGMKSKIKVHALNENALA